MKQIDFFFALMLFALTTLPTGAYAEPPAKPLFVVFIGGINSDPTAAQMAGTAQRGVGNSGMFQLAADLRQDGVAAEYFNWNGAAAGKIKEKQAPLSKGIAEQIRKRHADHPKDKLVVVGNSWGGHTPWEVSQLLANTSDFGRRTRSTDGRDLELREVLPALLNRFQERFICKVLAPQRPNVAL